MLPFDTFFCLIFSCLAVTSQNSLKEEKGEDCWIAVLNKGQQVQSTWKKMCFTLYTLPLWCCASCTLTTDNHYHPDPKTILSPPHNSAKNPYIQNITLQIQCNIWHICIFFFLTTTSHPVSRLSSFPTLPLPPPPLIFLSHPLLLVFCCVLVKSQLATVSRSLAALTMASGIMLNTAPRLLSPSTGISDALWSTQERDGGLSMKMSLQLHKCVSQTPSLSALPPLASPFPTF